MSEPDRAPSEIAAGYQTKVTAVHVASSTWAKVASADARRVYIDFFFVNGLGLWAFGPDGIQNTTPQQINTQPTLAFKLRDAPALVIGEWYVAGFPAVDLYVIEQLKVG
jgi:hypothetical protein